MQLNPNKTFQATVDGSTTEAIVYMKTLGMEASSSFDYYVPAGVTVNISISSSDSTYPTSMVWTLPTALTGIAGASRGRYPSASFTAIKIARTAGSGLVELTISAT